MRVNEALGHSDGVFSTIYVDTRRESIATEKLMRASLLRVFYSVRAERQRMQQMRYKLLFGWFVGLALDDKGNGLHGSAAAGQRGLPASRVDGGRAWISIRQLRRLSGEWSW
ncbi:MAG: hypothetical protein Fur0039_03650 [Rhodocyclaceae bacterium]